MNKLHLAPLSLLCLAVFLSVNAFAQNGRGQRGQQQQKSGQARNGQPNQQTKGPSQNSGQTGQTNQGGPNRKQANGLTANEIQGLTLMREEEKFARDVYVTLQAKWNEDVFANISRAESQHMSAVGNLLNRYRIPDPVQNDATGAFTSQTFQQLYQTLVATGSTSREDALRVGLKIEEMDIADLRVALQATKNQDITRVLENLLRGSRNHLRAFASRLTALGGTYTPTSLSLADFNQIASSPQETGRGNGQQGSGQGNAQNGNAMGGKGQQGQRRGQGQGSGQGQGQGRGQGKGRGNGKFNE